MSPVLPRKKYRYIVADKHTSVLVLDSCVGDLLDKDENVLVLISEDIESPQELEKNLKMKFWRRLNDEKLRILIVPEINSIILFDIKEIEIKKNIND